MSQSPLQLDRYFFVKISLEANAKGDPKAVYNIEAKTDVSRDESQERHYLVSLTVRLTPLDEAQPCYVGEVVVMGYFQVHQDYPAEKCDKLVAMNGASMLYGAVREMVSNLSARGPWPMVVLAPMNFADLNRQEKSGIEATGQP
jgi:preprotein translocase subunit SecB